MNRQLCSGDKSLKLHGVQSLPFEGKATYRSLQSCIYQTSVHILVCDKKLQLQ